MNRLLLIEDDLITANLVKRTLEMYGIDVFHVTDGLVGLQAARDYSPDAILVDLNLPDIDGKVVALQLRKSARWARTPIIAFTAYAGEKMKKLAVNFGCTDMISKPIDPTTFHAQLMKIIAAQPGTSSRLLQ
jgi:two-component system cell cycle response regulator DivK